jgi:tetratricopeptide (TPR) repeat protein
VPVPVPVPPPGKPRAHQMQPRPRFRTRSLLRLAIPAVAAAALVILYLGVPRAGDPPPEAVAVFAGFKTRPYDVRFADADAGAYRRRAELLGGSTSPRERVSRATLAWLESHDRHGLAVAIAWNGDNRADAVEQLRALAQTPVVRSDRAAVEMLDPHGNVESILAELEALAAGDDPAAARAARWNHAILLSQLELPLVAAAELRAIAGEHEPGWADEAATRAAAEEARAHAAQASWNRANTAGQSLVATGAPVPTELAQAFPGLIRTYFYEAVRTAPSRERVRALAPLAAELDRPGGEPLLTAYVQRVASFDFRRRAPLADAYARLRTDPSARLTAELTTATPAAEVADIVMGAMFERDAVVDHLEAYGRLARQTGDPWFEIVALEARATAEERQGRWLGAEAALRKAQKLCGNASVGYRCLAVARQLGRLYEQLHRIPEALAVLHTGLRDARSAGEWGQGLQLLWRLGDAERLNSSTATARAYAGEVLASDPRNCQMTSAAHMTLASVALLEVDGRAARRAFEAAASCRSPSASASGLNAASMLADIGRLDPRAGDLAELQGRLHQIRSSATLPAAAPALTDEIDGRLRIESQRPVGIALLERAIAAAEALPADDVDARRARTGAYSVLVLDAARNAEHDRVMDLLGHELGLPRAGACTVALAAEDERAVVAVRGVDGRDQLAYQSARRARDAAPSVSAELARGLAGCARVEVRAQAGLQGLPRVLPPTLAWSYATGAHGAGKPTGAAPAEATTLIVTNVRPPPELQLPALLPQMPDPAPRTRTLSGPEATPARVLAAMADAGEIQFHTHALLDAAVSDASHLVLSPGPDGRYALTAEAIRRIELRGHPVVVLAACHSAVGARYQHAPWSLPHALLASGARAVFAAGTAIPDVEAGAFFARVLDRVRAGTDPAVALRDERTAALASHPDSWVADVVLFE